MHPTQALCDVFTIMENVPAGKKLEDVNVMWIGDNSVDRSEGNLHIGGVCRSNALIASIMGYTFISYTGEALDKKTQRGYSTDAKTLSKLEDVHPIAREILRYRELAKMESTYIEALPRMRAGDGLVHTHFNQTVTTTGRLSSSDPNLQNIPVRTEFGRRIRGCFVPLRTGDLFMSADYSQIELRLLAHGTVLQVRIG